EKAKQLRRCERIKADGQRCRNYSRLDSNVCGFHFHNPAIRRPKGRERGEAVMRRLKIRAGLTSWRKNKKKVCRCRAYNWPHRAGGGLCRWPDPPIFLLATPAGTQSGDGSLKRKLRKYVSDEYTRAINYERHGEVKVITENLSETERRALLAIAERQRRE